MPNAWRRHSPSRNRDNVAATVLRGAVGRLERQITPLQFTETDADGRVNKRLLTFGLTEGPTAELSSFGWALSLYSRGGRLSRARGSGAVHEPVAKPVIALPHILPNYPKCHLSLANYKMGGKTALLRYYGPGRGRLVR
jgi:hypothetical protein